MFPTPEACVDPSAADGVAEVAHRALMDELRAWPKPGLVSRIDCGSHRDMDFSVLARSADAIRPFFDRLARAGEERRCLADLRRIGLDAEASMMAATGGVNAHRGAIFALGLLCAAEGASGYARRSGAVRAATVGRLWGESILDEPVSACSHGARAARRFGVGGARKEAAAGFPTVQRLGLPALEAGRRLAPGDPDAAQVHCLFALMAELDDTNLLHRGGAEGLAFARTTAARFVANGGVGASGWREEAIRLHRAFVARGLSPGGSADMLAVCLFLDALIPP